MAKGVPISDVPWEARVIDSELRNGKPELGWKGDPRLSLRLSVLQHPRTKKIVARRYEIDREMEDGRVVSIGNWKITELHEIIPDLIKMDPSSRGHESVLTRLERHERAQAKAQEDAFVAANFDTMDHLVRLFHDRYFGRNTFRFGRSTSELARAEGRVDEDGKPEKGYKVTDRRASASVV